jgi:activator of HSP90 ATPase
MKTKNITQTVTLSAAPKVIYDMLMDSKKHAAFTGAKATMSKKVGAVCSAYDKYITAINLELVPNKKIVQAWRAKDWAVSHWSIICYELWGKGKNTEVRFTQCGVPEDQYKDLNNGWKEFYWEPMQAVLEKKK